MNIRVKAFITPGSFNLPEAFAIDGMNVGPFFPHVIEVGKDLDSSDSESIQGFIEKVERLCVCLFLTDYSPRLVDGYLYNQIPVMPLSKEGLFGLNMLFKLGSPVKIERYTQPQFEHIKSIMGNNAWLFNVSDKMKEFNLNPTLVIDWYTFFQTNINIEQKVSLIMRGFGQIFVMRANIGQANYQKIASALLLLIPGLEGLFTSNSDDNSDITFKFATVGSLFYTKYASEDFLKALNAKKLSYQEINELFRSLYKLRSDVAHGTFSRITRHSNWEPLLRILKIGCMDATRRYADPQQMLFALGMLEKHIIALIHGAKLNLNKGVQIIEQLAEK